MSAGTLVDGGATGSTGGTEPSFIGMLNKSSESGTAPKAYLNFLVFDRDYNLVNGGAVRVTEAAREYGQDGAHEKLTAKFTISEAGYVYVYLSNDNVALGGAQVDVFFDDFQVIHAKSPMVQQDNYYPFGLLFNSYQRENTTPNSYLYNSKELQDELALNTYDFGFRQYDPAVGRWSSIDPLAEKIHWMSPYNYVRNNPINRFDPDGLTDYTLNKKTGEITEVKYDDKEKQKANEESKTDRIVRTNRKGEIKTNKNGDARTAVGDIEKGILKDGQNFKTDDQIINVGGEGQASLAGVEDFVTKFSEYVGVEIAGAYLSQENSAGANISKVYIDEYQGNKTTESSASFTKLFTDPSLKGYHTITDFHTHPSSIGASRTERPSGTTGQGGDLSFRDNNRRYFYNFLILTRTATYPYQVQRIDYTNWKR